MFESNSPVLSEKAAKDLVECIVAPDCFSVEVLVDALKVSIQEITTKLTKNPLGLHEFYSHHFDKHMKLTLSICIRASSLNAGSIKIHSLEIEWNPEDPPPMNNIDFLQHSEELGTDFYLFNMYLVHSDISEGEGLMVMDTEFAEVVDEFKRFVTDVVLTQSQLSRCVFGGHSNVQGHRSLKFKQIPRPMVRTYQDDQQNLNSIQDVFSVPGLGTVLTVQTKCGTENVAEVLYSKDEERTVSDVGLPDKLSELNGQTETAGNLEIALNEGWRFSFRESERMNYSFSAGLQRLSAQKNRFQSMHD